MPDDVILIRLERAGDLWNADARRGGASLVVYNAGESPGVALEAIALELDRLETDRITAATAAATPVDRELMADVAEVMSVLADERAQPPRSQAHPGELGLATIAERAGIPLERAHDALTQARRDGVVRLRTILENARTPAGETVRYRLTTDEVAEESGR